MKKQLLMATGMVLLAAFGFVAVSLLAPPAPVAVVRVTDEKGSPVSGATIAPDGLRPKKGGGHYGWSDKYARSGVKAEVVKTDSDGYARVHYPYYVIKKLETEQISFAVGCPFVG